MGGTTIRLWVLHCADIEKNITTRSIAVRRIGAIDTPGRTRIIGDRRSAYGHAAGVTASYRENTNYGQADELYVFARNLGPLIGKSIGEATLPQGLTQEAIKARWDKATSRFTIYMSHMRSISRLI